MNWETVIGLEVHAQLSTQSKLFSNAPTQYGAAPNSQVSGIDAGLPGTLPVLNQRAVEMAIQFGLAINATINNDSYFERKNYIYPDLPKGYQISQYQRPIVGRGELRIKTADGCSKSVLIERAHLEEDAGKSTHENLGQYTGIDLNRAGTPLLEIVTAPCLHSADEAIAYLKTLHQLLRFLGICDGNMQEGSFRCDVNLSLRPLGQKTLGTRTELKNLNSFRFIEKAIQFEQLRHQELLESGQIIHQETRLYNPDKHQTELLRRKESDQDYRYFPDPDLLPIHFHEDYLKRLRETLPPLPQTLANTLKTTDGLSHDAIDFLLASPTTLRFYQAVKANSKATGTLIVNWLKGIYTATLNERGLTFETPPIQSATFACLIQRLQEEKLSNNSAKRLFALLLDYPDATEKTVDELIQREGLNTPQDTTAIENLVQDILAQAPEQVAEYHAGKDKLMGFFIGQVMKACKGGADPVVVQRLVLKLLAAKAV